MTVPNFHAKLSNLLGMESAASESMILAQLRNLVTQRDTYKELAEKEPFGLRSTRWEVIGVGEMVSAGGKAWHVTKRQVQEGRRVKIWLRATGDKPAERTYGFDDVADVLTPSAETAVLRLLRTAFPGMRLQAPEEAA